MLSERCLYLELLIASSLLHFNFRSKQWSCKRYQFNSICLMHCEMQGCGSRDLNGKDFVILFKHDILKGTATDIATFWATIFSKPSDLSNETRPLRRPTQPRKRLSSIFPQLFSPHTCKHSYVKVVKEQERANRSGARAPPGTRNPEPIRAPGIRRNVQQMREGQTQTLAFVAGREEGPLGSLFRWLFVGGAFSCVIDSVLNKRGRSGSCA